MPIVHDPFHRELKKRLDGMIEKYETELSNGSATANVDEPVSTAEKYAAQVARVVTLRVILAICDEVAEEIIRPAKVNIEER
jgi:hypothetical protein